MSILPKHWVEAPLGEICELVNGRAFKPSEWAEEGKPIIRIQNLNRAEATFNYFDGEIDPKHAVSNGDLLFAWSGTPGTSFGAHIWKGEDAVLNQHIFRVDFDRSLIDSTYLAFAINQTLDELIDQAHGGVGLRHVTKAVLSKTLIRLPPHEEQLRIATALQTAEAKIGVAIESLKSALTLAGQYWVAVLNRAFTPEADHPDHERRFVRLEALIDEGPSNGWSPATGPDATGALTLRLTATTSGQLRLDEAAVKRIYEQPSADSRYWLQPGDLLVQRANALEHLGSAAIFDGPANTYIYPDLMMRIRIADPDRRRYIWRYINSPAARAYIRNHATGTSGNMPKISGGILRALPVPLPKGDDYRSVVDAIDREFGAIEAVRKVAQNALEALAVLHKSVLAKAFDGGIVAPAPAKRTAAELLKEIRSRRDSALWSMKSRKVSAERGATKREEIMDGKRRADVSVNHLQLTLTDLGGSSSAKDLWRKSGLTIDEFYKQLRTEIQSGTVRVGRTPGELAVLNAA
ncbi:MAG TPA: restriction endonuclease subunit S [Allosphingosinicella sp.]|uniref:restriction endonuclease subunit S n=1 Tax=Allosphingosinicella sp. TaxID=2823234 RepID=UPI002ED901AE